MQPAGENYNTISRRTLDVEDYIDILRRHKAWILGPAFGAMVLAVVVAFLWPDTYVSAAVIRVVPPTVPDNYVPTNINLEMSQRINSMAQTILSRGNLTNIINTFNLYPRERQRKPMEDVVEQMRRDVRIGNVMSMTNQANRGLSAFQVTFAYENRIMAQKVTADIVSRFMSENTRDRTQISVLTTQFLKDQWESAKKELDDIEARLAVFKAKNAGRLPDQVQNNYARLGALEQRMANLNSAISGANQAKMLLEAELRAQKNMIHAIQPPSDAGGLAQQQMQKRKSERVAELDREIEQMETQLAVLRGRYKDTYPDIQRLASIVAMRKRDRERALKDDEAERLEAQKANEQQAATPRPRPFDPNMVREMQNLQSNVERIEAQIRQRNIQIDEFNNEVKITNQQIKDMQVRLSELPIGEKEYLEVIRDRELAKMKYEDLNRKRGQSQIAEDLEKRQQGETLEVLDPASLPASPTEPKRPLLIAIGVGVGLVFGVFLAGAREAKDTSLKNLKDVRAYTQLNILGSVPLLENDLVVRRRRRLTWLAWSTACLVGIMIMTGSVFYYFATKV